MTLVIVGVKQGLKPIFPRVVAKIFKANGLSRTFLEGLIRFDKRDGLFAQLFQQTVGSVKDAYWKTLVSRLAH